MSRYDGPIVDAHQHFWEPSLGRIPWLRPDAHIAFRYGEYDAIKRDYLPPDLLADAGPLRVVGTVSMETEWDPDDPLGEIAHIESVQRRFGLPDAAVAHAVLADPKVEAVLERLADRPIVRAVRNKPGQSRRAAAEPTLISDDQWRRGYALLAAYGLDFELQTAWWHLDEAIRLGRTFPDISITINHTGLPADRSRDGIESWAAALARIAQLPHVWLKISGIGVRGVPWTVEANREIVERAASVFGPDRIMFASNFPVDRLTGSYQGIMGGFLDITSSWSPDEQRGAFAENAVRRYRLDPDVLERLSAPTEPSPALPAWCL
jgi:predicted TIM-barrel fold metal-dependent hydrolase